MIYYGYFRFQGVLFQQYQNQNDMQSCGFGLNGLIGLGI